MVETSILVILFVSIFVFTIYHCTLLYQHSSTSQAYDINEQPISIFMTKIEHEYYIQKSYQDFYTFTVLNDLKKFSLPVVYEKDVVVLSEKNFSHFIAKNQYVLVNFHASWCSFCKKLVPEYVAAATMLKAEGSRAVLAIVDDTKGAELMWKYQISGFPTMYFFVNGVNLIDHYKGERTRGAIATWVKSNMIPDIYTITTTEKAEHILTSGSMIVLGFFNTLEGPESKELAAAAKLVTDVNFYQTASANVAKIFHLDPHVKRPALVILKNETEIYSHFDGQFTRSAIANFVSMNKLPLVITFNLENAPLIFKNPLTQLWLFASSNDAEVMPTFQNAAKAFKEKLLFVHVEISYVERQIYHESGVSGDIPYVVGYTGYAEARKYVLDGELTLSSIKSFGESLLEEKLSGQLDPKISHC